MNNLTRESAWQLFQQYNETDYLKMHALSVEAVMRYYAEKEGEDVEKWGIIGLLHDLDFEKYPQEHCIKVVEILKEHSYPQEYIHAIVSHSQREDGEGRPQNQMEKILYTIDELCGLIYATVLMRPSRSLDDLSVRSVKKKFKSKGFAAGVNRDIILEGVEMLPYSLDEVIEDAIEGLKRSEQPLEFN